MRMWPVELLDVLPKKQITSQWRELSAISGAITKNGTPNHLLVNKVLNYSLNHLIDYAVKVMEEMLERGMNPSENVIEKNI